MTGAIPPHSSPSWQFQEALPSLIKIADDLQQALQPAMTQGRDYERTFAQAGRMLSKALDFLLQAAQSDDPSGFDAALAGADVSALAAAGHMRSLRAAQFTPDELATAGEVARSSGMDLGECAATGVTVRILWPDPGQGAATDEIQADLDALGRARWGSSRHGKLPIDGRIQLDLAAALDAIAALYTRVTPRATA